MEQIPNNNNQLSDIPLDFEDLKKKFKNEFSNLMEPKKKIDNYYEILKIDLINNLEQISKENDYTILIDFFEILIDLWINKCYKGIDRVFLSLREIYDIFSYFDFRIIESHIIDKLIGALQWSIISSSWINYYFIQEYFRNLSKETPLELRIKTWNLVELTRIKK